MEKHIIWWSELSPKSKHKELFNCKEIHRNHWRTPASLSNEELKLLYNSKFNLKNNFHTALSYIK
jgi:hypothetical protein